MGPPPGLTKPNTLKKTSKVFVPKSSNSNLSSQPSDSLSNNEFDELNDEILKFSIE